MKKSKKYIYNKRLVVRWFGWRFIRFRVSKLIFSTLPFLAKKFNFYPEGISFEDAADEVLCDETKTYALKKLGVHFDEYYMKHIDIFDDMPPQDINVRFLATLHKNIELLGSTGLAVHKSSGKAMWHSTETLPKNYARAKALQEAKGYPDKAYVNMLGTYKGHRHFYHFFSDFIKLYMYLKKIYKDTDKVVIAVRDDLSQIQIDIYDALIKKYPNLEIIKISPYEKLVCDKLINLYTYTKGKHENLFANEYMDFINKLFIDYYFESEDEVRADAFDLIYISRKDTKLRNILNEDELLPVLEKYGFKVVITGNIPFKEQIKLFKNAKAIITTHGAALTNLMFIEEGTRILELCSNELGRNLFTWIAQVRGGVHKYLICGGEEKRQSFKCDPLEFELAIKNLLEDL